MIDYIKKYGYVPWTITIADTLDAGYEWDKEEISKALRKAQADIDKLTDELQNINNILLLKNQIDAIDDGRC
jgi:hypothetical protein